MLFRYTATDKEGALRKGEREVEDEKSLARGLRAEGLILVSAQRGGSWLSWKQIASFSIGGVGLFDRMIFARNLAVMIGAGLAMTRAFEALEEQASNKRLRVIIARLKDDIVRGLSFSQALALHRKTFGDFFIHMVEAGEVSGKLEGSLKLLARQMKRDHDLRAKVRGAMIYPLIVIGALIGIGVLMLVYVVPTLTQTFNELGVQLPLSTRLILGASDTLTSYGIYFGGVFAALGVLLYRIVRIPAIERVWHGLVLRIPVFGTLVKKLNAARMARTLSSLIAAGLSITKSLEITSKVVGNRRFSETLGLAILLIEKGETLSAILKRSPDLYPPLVTQMLSVGEETGTLSRMLLRIALFYEEDVNNTTKNLSSIIEPAMMIVIGTIVGFFAISMIQPLYSSLTGF